MSQYDSQSKLLIAPVRLIIGYEIPAPIFCQALIVPVLIDPAKRQLFREGGEDLFKPVTGKAGRIFFCGVAADPGGAFSVQAKEESFPLLIPGD